MQLTSMGAKLNFKTEQERLEYEKVLSLISESADEIRSVSHQMMPNALLRLGLVSALQEFVQKINGSQLSVYLDVQGLDQRMDAEVETTLYRVIQESVNNVIKHAQASRLDIQLIRDDKELSVTIEDNGKGFDSKNPAYTVQRTPFGEGGLGLKNLRSRIEYLNGTLDIESSVGKGTLVAIYLPM
jgi:signal transduction histidine kinase